jgi:ribonuclease HII
VIPQEELWRFIMDRMPIHVIPENNTTIIELKDAKQIKESAREEMWWELVQKHIFEDALIVKKKQMQECIAHKGYSKEFENYVWNIVSEHKRGYSTPRIPYLLDAFLFNGKRIKMDTQYSLLEEQILYALIEYLMVKKVT